MKKEIKTSKKLKVYRVDCRHTIRDGFEDKITSSRLWLIANNKINAKKWALDYFKDADFTEIENVEIKDYKFIQNCRAIVRIDGVGSHWGFFDEYRY